MRCKHTAKMVQLVTKCPLTFFFTTVHSVWVLSPTTFATQLSVPL